jgi:pimeloyl-ACP methyl ester carboxylesterase
MKVRTAAMALFSAALFLAVACGGSETQVPGFTPVASFVPPAEDVVPVEAGFTDANGARLYYEVYGEGEPLLLVPGLSSSHLGWLEEVPAYSREFKVIVYDPRGTGQSSFPDGVKVTMALMADDAVAVLDALGIDAANVYGISLGGAIVQHIALRHPDRVLSLILGATGPGGTHAVPAEGWAMEALVAAVTQGNAAPPETVERFYEAMFSPSYVAEHRAEVIARFTLREEYPQTLPEASTAQMGATAGHDTYDQLPSIAAPTLVIDGADDPIFPAENSRILAERIPGAELVLLEGARHVYIIEKQTEADAAVLDFLRRHS